MIGCTSPERLDFLVSLLLHIQGEGQFFNLNSGFRIVPPVSTSNGWQILCAKSLAGPFMCILLFFQKEGKKTGTNLEPKVISCLSQHFKYYVRVWLSVPKHSNFFPLGSSAPQFHGTQAKQVIEAKWRCLFAT